MGVVAEIVAAAIIFLAGVAFGMFGAGHLWIAYASPSATHVLFHEIDPPEDN